MKTATVENPALVPSRNRVVADLAELVKARLTLLVLLTTAVGFYLGSESPINYVALFHVVFGTAAAAASTSARGRFIRFWRRVSGDCLQCAECGADGNNGRHLHFCLHTSKTRQHRQHGGWRSPGRDSADDRVGGCA